KAREVTLSLRTYARDDRDAPTAHHLHLRAFIRTNARALHIRDDADANVFAFGSEFWLNFIDKFVIINSFERVVEQRFIVAAVIHQRRKILIDDVVVIRELIRRDEIASADFGAVDVQLLRSNIQRPLDNEHTMLTSRAPIWCDDGLIREDR